MLPSACVTGSADEMSGVSIAGKSPACELFQIEKPEVALGREKSTTKKLADYYLILFANSDELSAGQLCGAGITGQGAKVTGLATRFNFLSYVSERSPNIGMLLFNVLLIGIGSYLAFAGSLSIGSLVSFNALFITVSTAVMGLTAVTPTLLQATGGMRRVREILDSLYEQLGVVFQESFLFNTSVRENIRLDRLEATDAEVEEAARDASRFSKTESSSAR
jgi:ABC-type multidrug transport system fused ATPase/permease subunit